MSTMENKARLFKAALEALQVQTERLIQQLDLEIKPYDESKSDDYHAGETLYDFHDALVGLSDPRNEYISVAEIDTEDLILNWKEQK